MALKSIMINDIISEHSARMQNLTKYYPFFVLQETTFAQYKEGRYQKLDMGYITMASLRFFINENNFHERAVSYEEYELFLDELLSRDFLLDEEPEEKKQLISYIFDKIKNDGRAFEFKFYEPEAKEAKIARTRLIESRISEGKLLYTITAEGIEFYLDTKEIKDESKINVAQLLLEKMIVSNNFKGGIDVVKRINSQVASIKQRKEQVLKLLAIDVFEGARAYEEYMDTTAKWFSDEQKLFVKNKALVEKAIEKASYEGGNTALKDIANLENELKKTIYNHGKLMEETVELKQVSDGIIERAKIKKLRPVFSFRNALSDIMEKDSPELLSHVLMPLFAPRTDKSFSMKSIDNILTLKLDDTKQGEKIVKEDKDLSFCYEDEILDKKIAENFTKLFVELIDQLAKWGKVSLKELNGIYEIKFGKDIYNNKDYYAFLVHLAMKKEYSLEKMFKKQDTLLEEMVIQNMEESDRDKFSDMEFTLTFGTEKIVLSPEYGQFDEEFFVTDIVFERRIA